MLKKWTTYAEYARFVLDAIWALDTSSLKRLTLFDNSLRKLTLLNLDGLGEKLRSYYSMTGRPAELQPEIFRSFVLMADRGKTSGANWVKTLTSDDTPYQFILETWAMSHDLFHSNPSQLNLGLYTYPRLGQ